MNPLPEGQDYPKITYTNGELRAIASPVFGVNHDRIADLAIVMLTTDGLVGVHAMRDDMQNRLEGALKDSRLLICGLLNILDDMTEIADTVKGIINE